MNKGYNETMNLKLNKEIIQSNLNQVLKVLVYDEIDSTNNEAKRLKLSQDSLIVAQDQTHGRGRYQRSFYSRKNEGLYFSLVLKYRQLDAQLLTLIIAVVISNILKETKIKWLNDILLHEKKMGGILCESTITNNEFNQIIIGVGLNLNVTHPPKELEGLISSYHEVDSEFDINELLCLIINEFFELMSLDKSIIVDQYKKKCVHMNQWVSINHESILVKDITLEGYLVGVNTLGETQIFNNAEVSLDVNK